MEPSEVKELIGKEVWYVKEERLADIVSFGSGWVTISMDEDGEVVEKKVRAKDIVLMDSEDDLNVSDNGEVELTKPDPSSNSSDQDLVEGEYHCSCGLTWVPPKTECFKCPDCGRWHRVRLHPDLSRYVKGMAATPSGRDTVDIDDQIAEMVRGMDLDELYPTICNELAKLDPEAQFVKSMAKDFELFGGTCAEYLSDRYSHLNPGMQHMNMRNLLRGAIKRQEALDEKVALKKEVKKELTPTKPADTEIDPKYKEWIDNASFEDLLRKNRFAPVGDPMMLDATGEYFLEVMNQRKKEVGEAEAVATSKRIGWDK